ncbi:MAG TPA: ATP-binding protein [Mycobacteriales bacterium]|nr:ATP-binding protein [Mycobacteriales bacterium]
MSLAICLPRDELSVPVIRHLVRYALDQVGVIDAISSDIEVALTEACANVLRHAGPGDSYEVGVAIGPDNCELRVVDAGRGFDHSTVQSTLGPHDLDAERGRGLRLMHALVDHIELVSAPEKGTLVHLVKQLVFDDSARARRLLSQSPEQHDEQVPLTDFVPYPQAGKG